MDEETQAGFNELMGFGETPQPAQEPEKDEDRSAEEETEDTQGDPEVNEEETEEEDTAEPNEENSEEEETKEGEEEEKAAGNLKKALDSERDLHKATKSRMRDQIDKYESLFSDPEFLADRYDQLERSKAEGKLPNRVTSAEIAEAPYYPNTDGGHERRQRDIDESIRDMPQLAVDGRLATALKAIVREGGMSYPQAAKELKGMLEAYAAPYKEAAKKQGKDEMQKVTANKAKLTTAAKPRAGMPSESARRAKDMGSSNRTVRERAQLKDLGFI